MEKSEDIGILAKSLCEVQSKLAGAKRDSVNPFFKSQYADLSSVWDACRSLLTENGLSVVQTNSLPHQESTTVVDTTLLHSSGQWISGSLEVPLAKTDPQGLGSAITYARRYALAAIVGISPEDDDAEGAVRRDTKPKDTTTKPKEKPPVVATDGKHFKNIGELFTEANKIGVDRQRVLDLCEVKTSNDIKDLSGAWELVQKDKEE